jgi:hypothetical protein
LIFDCFVAVDMLHLFANHALDIVAWASGVDESSG